MKASRKSFWSGASLVALLGAAPVAALATPTGSVETTPGLQEALLSVTVNGAPAGEPVTLLKGVGGKFYATAAILSSWRLTAPRRAFSRDGTDYYLLNAIPGLRLELAEATQTLSLTARAESLGLTRLPYAAVDLDERLASGSGGFVNYDLTAQMAAGETSMGRAFETGLFTRFGVGIASFVGRWSKGAAELVRLDTAWTVDDPAGMRSVRLGDAVSRGGVGGAPLRFGGIQLARNFAVQPGFVTIPLPSLSGSAAWPSVVDIYVNDALRGSREVPAGPFEIIEVPIVTGNGDVQLVVRDLLGRQMLTSQAYYAAPSVLRKGLHDYSYEAGFLRGSFGQASNNYGAAIASATHRYGFSDRFTGEVHAEVSRDTQLAGAAASLAVPGIGFAEVSLAASRSDLGLGALAGVSLERRSRSLSLGIRGEFTTADYLSLGSSRSRRPPASTVQAFAGIPTRFGSLGLTYLRRNGRGEPDAEFVSANSSLRLGRFGSLHIAGRKSLSGDRELAARLFLVMPLGRSASASAGAAFDGGRTSFRTALQRGLPVGNGLGYKISASSGAIDRLDARLSLNTGFGAHDAQLTWTDGKTGVRLSTTGGIGLIGRDAFASRRLDQSFASVKVGDYPGVRVYAENQVIGRTGRDGRLVVPRLRPFDRNRLRIELADLPWDAEVSGDERIVRPFARHGVVVDFAVKPARAAIIRILLEDGTFLPGGSVVRLNQGPDEFVAAPGGEVYLTALDSRNRSSRPGPQAAAASISRSCRPSTRSPASATFSAAASPDDAVSPSGRGALATGLFECRLGRLQRQRARRGIRQL